MVFRQGFSRSALCVLLTAPMLGGCANAAREKALDRAEASVSTVRNDPEVQRYASVDLNRTEEELARMQAANADGAGVGELQHLGYLVEQRVAITAKHAEEQTARADIERLGDEREQILLQAERSAASDARQRAARAEQQTQSALDEAQQARANAQQLQNELQDLQAQRTARGLVVTLGDVLFDVDKATLKPGGETQVARLAAVLRDTGGAPIVVEGHTDSAGTESYNVELSRARAATVRDALIAGGIASERISARGLGEAYPVISNATEAGRQQNRRVEIIVADS